MTGEPQFKLRLPDGQEFGPAAIPILAQWAREGRVPKEALIVSADGAQIRSVLTEPALAAVVLAPPTISTGLQQAATPDAPLLIPYKNGPALFGYYLGVFSLIPFLGIPLGIAAIICGIFGIRKAVKNPKVRGMAHAIVALILGLITTGGYTLLIIAMVANT